MQRCNISHTTYSPSLKNSFRVLENRLENLTKSRFRCSSCCFPSEPGINPVTSFTASNSFLIALAISLQNKNKERCLDSFLINSWLHKLRDISQNPSAYLIVSRNVWRSVISSGIRQSIFFKAADFLFNSWKASSDRFSRYSTTKMKMKLQLHAKLCTSKNQQSWQSSVVILLSASVAAPWRRKTVSLRLTLNSPRCMIPTTKS